MRLVAVGGPPPPANERALTSLVKREWTQKWVLWMRNTLKLRLEKVVKYHLMWIVKRIHRELREQWLLMCLCSLLRLLMSPCIMLYYSVKVFELFCLTCIILILTVFEGSSVIFLHAIKLLYNIMYRFDHAGMPAMMGSYIEHSSHDQTYSTVLYRGVNKDDHFIEQPSITLCRNIFIQNIYISSYYI